MARKIPSLGRFLGVRALYAMAYGEISSSLYYALGITAVYALSLTPVVFAAAGLLFAGDHVLPHITPSIGFQPVITRSSLQEYLGSLQLMLALPDTRLLPAHGPVQASTHARVHQLLEHHETRLEQTLEAASDGPVTAFEAAGALRMGLAK